MVLVELDDDEDVVVLQSQQEELEVDEDGRDVRRLFVRYIHPLLLTAKTIMVVHKTRYTVNDRWYTIHVDAVYSHDDDVGGDCWECEVSASQDGSISGTVSASIM